MPSLPSPEWMTVRGGRARDKVSPRRDVPAATNTGVKAMLKAMLTAAALALLATGAQANDKVQGTCSLFGCVVNSTQDAETKIIHVPSGMQLQTDDEQWLRFCKPYFIKDSLGVERAVYAHPGCDVGRSR